MKLCVAFGFTYEESYAIKKACGKKNEKEVSMYVDKFKNLIKQKGYGLDIQNKLVNILLNSASYSFNKSHAICYAILVYESAWLKKHYNTIFMANLLTNMYENKNKDNVHNIVEACKKNGINFIPVDINKSDWEFKQCGEKTIRIGFCAIPMIGKRAAEEILYGRTYSSMEDFINKNKISNNFICKSQKTLDQNFLKIFIQALKEKTFNNFEHCSTVTAPPFISLSCAKA